MNDRQTDRTEGSLQRIAHTLGMPIGAFYGARDEGQWDGGRASGEIQTLFRAFLALRDPAARRRAIAAVGAELLV